MAAQRLLSELVDLVLPRDCVGCGRPGAGLCRRCAQPTPVQVGRAGDLAGVPIAVGARYADGLRTGLLAFKERGRRDLAGPLARLLAHAVAELRTDPSAALVPVPSTRLARRQRGVDHVRVLAHSAARYGGRVVERPLEHARATLDSAGLGAAERAANVHGALRALPPRGRAAIVVDDIVTTGATLAEAVRALECVGWRVCGAAAVAATPLRDIR